MKEKDSLGDRMKADYESRTRYCLPRRTYTLVRVDGRAFHTYTRGCARPFDRGLMADMDATAAALCASMSGARLAFVQSDEISILLTDFDTPRTEAWFDNNLQKLCSLSASLATAYFNRARSLRGGNHDRLLATFDSRVWTIPQRGEVFNYFVWRQQDAARNALSMTAQAHFSQTALQGKDRAQLRDLLTQERGIDANDQPAGFLRGRVIERVTLTGDQEYVDGRTGETRRQENVTRHEWQVAEPPLFTEDRDWLFARIPAPPGE